MDFFIIPRYERSPKEGANKAYLNVDHWNDFSFVTMFYLTLHDEQGRFHEVGNVKIAFKGQDTSSATFSKLENGFSQLDEGFFSLGESLEYYKSLNKLPRPLREELLNSLLDIAFIPEIIEKIKEEEVFKTSLLRDISLTTIKGQFARVLNGKPALTDFNFSFVRKKTEDKDDISINFDVHESSTPSTNIHALIGRNGCGKTTILNGMIDAITERDNISGKFLEEDSWGRDTPISKDYFSSLVSVSFSAFDPFEPPEEQPDPTKGTCYYYIGLKNRDKESTLHSISELRAGFVKSLIDCFRKANKKKLWHSAIEKLGSDENFASMSLGELEERYNTFKRSKRALQIDDKEFRKLFLDDIDLYLSRMSSGHAIVLFTITQLVSTVEEKTLVLIDEPEGHLHPPLLSAFLRTLSELLYDQNGVAIIATHSPVVLQEIPKTCVWKINRVGKIVEPYRPEHETFGENVGVLTREVFGLEVSKSGYHDLLSKSVDAGGTYEEILLKYKRQLGLEARVILKTLVAHRDKG